YTLPPSSLYTLSLHDALPIYRLAQDAYFKSPRKTFSRPCGPGVCAGVADASRYADRRGHAARHVRRRVAARRSYAPGWPHATPRSEEHTSELQSPYDLVCRLL